MLIDPYRYALQDPDFGDTFMLIHVEGGQIYEVTGFPAVAVIGGGAVSAVDAEFGLQSFRNPGTGSAGNNYVRVQGAPTDFVFPGEFTWEGWFNVVSLNNTYNNFFANNINFPGAGFIQLAIINNGTRHILFNSSAGGFVAQHAFPLGVWQHLAVTRNAANVIDVYLHGVKSTSFSGGHTFSGNIGGASGGVSSFDVCRGHAEDNADLNCYFEEIRVTKVCRYTASFTPPTAPFPPFP